MVESQTLLTVLLALWYVLHWLNEPPSYHDQTKKFEYDRNGQIGVIGDH